MKALLISLVVVGFSITAVACEEVTCPEGQSYGSVYEYGFGFDPATGQYKPGFYTTYRCR